MTLSLSEVEALARKATRGAGYAWALADETARATRWLCTRGVDGCGALVGALWHYENVGHAIPQPPILGETWRSDGAGLCAVMAGCALSDHADILDFGSLRMEAVTSPILMVPFVASAARHLERSIALTWDNCQVSTDGEDLWIVGDAVGRGVDVVFSRSQSGPCGAPQRRCNRVNPVAEVQAALERFGHRTYAPATEASRLLGAGAETSDND